jgi:uncharacterized caspase-like protein
MCAALKASDFSATCLENLTGEDFDTAISRFISSLQPGDVALLYYSGHGFQSDGLNYLVPVDLVPQTESQARRRSISAAEVLEMMVEKKTSLQILVLDACRDNPFRSILPAARGLSSRGLASMQQSIGAAGAIIAFAAGPSQQADDNVGGSNGLYTMHLLESIRQPGISADRALKNASEAVKIASGGRQVPWIESSFNGEFYFQSAPAEAATTSAPAPSNHVSADTRAQLALALYQAIRNRTDPAESLALIDRFLQEYADLPLAEEVRLLKEKLSGGNGSAAPVPQPAPAVASQGNPASEEIFTRDGIRSVMNFSTAAEILPMNPSALDRRYRELREQIGWSATTGVAREWWDAFEKQNAGNVPTLIALEERLLARKATITEFFLAYMNSNVDQVLPNLDYLDYLNATRLPYPEYVRTVNFGDMAGKLRHAVETIAPGMPGTASQSFLNQATPKNAQEAASMLWLLQEAASRGYTLSELADAYQQSRTVGAIVHPLIFYAAYKRDSAGMAAAQTPGGGNRNPAPVNNDQSGLRLGLVLRNVTDQELQRAGLQNWRGCAVAQVEAGSVAQRAGFQQNDLIVAINGNATTSSADVVRFRDNTAPGLPLYFDVLRYTVSAGTRRKGTQRGQWQRLSLRIDH